MREGATTVSSERPPILIIMADQMRADCMSAAGHPMVRTPYMDRIAAEGTRFTRGCTNSPLCMPARASFVSGLYPHNHGMWNNQGELPADDETVFQHLQSAGYQTSYVGKSHFYPHGGLHMRDREGYMRARGLDDVHETTGPWATVNTDSYMTDEWAEKGVLQAFRDDYQRRRENGHYSVWPSPLSEEDHMDAYIGRKAVEWVDGYQSDQPPCLFVGFGGPHEPWDAPGSYATMYDPVETPPALPVDDIPAHVPEYARKRMVGRRIEGMTEANIQEIRGNYYGKISLIDHWVGQLIEAYGRRGWWDEAVVVFWSDHGEMAGDYGWLHKSNFHESALMVPMMVRWPGRGDAGRVSGALIETVDLLPTILEAAGCEPSARALGRSLAPLIDGDADTVRDAAFSEVGDSTMVRTEEHKYVMDALGRGHMLYDLEADPQEQTNLLGDPEHASLEAAMRDRVLTWLAQTQVRLR